eukprot:4956164-Amphidinium_carterae.1
MEGRKRQKGKDLVREKDLDRKRSGSGGSARQRKTSRDRDGRKKNNAAPVTFQCHSSDDDNSSIDPEDINEVNHWSDDEDEFEEPYEVAAARQGEKE